MKKGSLSINSENIFPVIKKWLYSDHDIFVRELISNGCDAVTKLKKLSLMGEFADPAERERLRLRKIALYPTFFDTVRLNRPLWDFCRQFRAQGGRVWIVSTGSRANIDNAMRHLGIAGPQAVRRLETPDEDTSRKEERLPEENAVDGILSGADVARSKPAPDCFLEAMRREGCTPRETLIFEDSEIGLEAARRSGASYFRVKL